MTRGKHGQLQRAVCPAPPAVGDRLSAALGSLVGDEDGRKIKTGRIRGNIPARDGITMAMRRDLVVLVLLI